jgi:hypothetical protein
MATSAQNATVTWGGTVVLSEVTAYAVDQTVSFGVQHGDAGAVQISFLGTGSFPTSEYGKFRLLEIKHGNTVVFRGGCVAERIRIEAQRNDIVRMALTFRIVRPLRNY